MSKHEGPITRVEISWFKPVGYVDTVFIRTDDRGAAALHALGKYPEGPMKCLNYITTNLCDEPDDAPVENL